MSAWRRARAQQAPGFRLARFESASRSRSRAPSRPAIVHSETDLLARTRGSGQAFVAVPSYGELVAQSYEYMEDQLRGLLEANT